VALGPWCLPLASHSSLPGVRHQLATELKGVVNVAKVDAEAHSSLRKRFRIRGYPTLIFFSQGKMYKYEEKRSLESLVAFAKGGYKDDTEAVDVPAPPDLIATLKGEFFGLLKTVLHYSKHPEAISQESAYFLAAGIVIGSVLASAFYLFLSLASPAPAKRVSQSKKGD